MSLPSKGCSIPLLQLRKSARVSKVPLESLPIPIEHGATLYEIYLQLLRRKATTRELARASLLFGLFPKADDDVAWMGVLGRTVSQAIDAECRLIEKAKARAKD